MNGEYWSECKITYKTLATYFLNSFFNSQGVLIEIFVVVSELINIIIYLFGLDFGFSLRSLPKVF